jgi:ribonuclease D
VAARRLTLAREVLLALAEEKNLPVENLLTPDHLRRVLWTPPETRQPEALTRQVSAMLLGLGSRPWQVDLATPSLVEAILAADEPPPDVSDDVSDAG